MARQCAQCGNELPDDVRFCTACGAPEGQADADPAPEHIRWALGCIPEWRRRGLISPSSAGMLRRRLEAELRDSGLAVPEPARRPDGVVSGGAPGLPEPDQPVTQEREGGPSRGLAAFFEENWLILLAILAGAFILGGMRQVLGWEWVSRLARTLMPAIPSVLSWLLLRAGMRAEGRRKIGPRACAIVGITLATFAVTSANRRWLGFALTPEWAIVVGMGVSLALAGWARRRSGDGFLEHAAFGATALLALLLPRAIVSSGGADAAPWLYPATYALLGGGCLAAGVERQRRNGTGAEALAATARAILWAHLSFAAVAALAIYPAVDGDWTAAPAPAIVGLVAVCYVAAARAVGDASLAYAGSGALALTAGLLLGAGHRSPTSPEGIALTTLLGAIAAALGQHEGRLVGTQVGRSPLAVAYGRMAFSAFVGAGLLILARAADAAAAGRPLDDAGWLLVSASALACSAAYGTAAVGMELPAGLYAAAAAGGFAVWLPSDRLLAASGAAPDYRFCLSMAMTAVVMAACASAFRVWAAAAAVAGIFERRPQQTPMAPAMGIPLAVSTLAPMALGLASAAHGYEHAGPRWELWAGLTALCALSGACAARMARIHDDLGGAAQVAGGLCLVGGAMLAAFLARETGAVPADVASGIALLAFAWAASLAAAWLRIEERPPSLSSLWRLPLRLVGGTGFALAWALLLHGGRHAEHQLLLADVFGVAAAVYALGCHASGRPDRTTVWGSAALLAAMWLVAPSDGLSDAQEWRLIGASAVAAASYGWAAWQGVPGMGWAAVFAGSAAWLGTTIRAMHANDSWWCLAQLPWLAGVFAVGLAADTPGRHRGGASLRRAALFVAIVYQAVAVIAAYDEVRIDDQAAIAGIWAFTLAFGIRAAWLPGRRWGALAAGHTLWASGATLLLMGVPGHTWTVRFALSCGAVVLGARILARSERGAAVAYGADTSAGIGAGVGLLVALAVVAEPGAGEQSLLAIALAGAVWASIWATGRGTIWAHSAALAFLLGYGLFLYNRFSISADVLDLYLLPVSGYLLVLGHMADRRRKIDAPILWWLGLLLSLTPTFVAFHLHFQSGGTPLHAILLIVQCVGAVLWGIARRIKAFAACGSLFALAFAGELILGAIGQIWAGLIALVVGSALLAAVYILSTRSAEARAVMDRAVRQWRSWR